MRSEYRARRSYGYSTDDPEGRLPQNMKRIAYDADTRQYTYRDTNGSLWNSSPSVEYGNMYRVSDRVRPQPNFIDMGEESDVDILEPDASPEGRKTVQRLWERVLPRQVTHFDRKIVPISTDTMDTKDSGVAPLSRRELRASRRRALDASESVSLVTHITHINRYYMNFNTRYHSKPLDDNPPILITFSMSSRSGSAKGRSLD